ncbi:periodic tryptophan protein 2-like protein, putative [Babesia caballi]|uniref:Periodic tryptophan protein 2-like protein, putative n=1 Tax=Babesia caballi TaxID=5871 RepID=A0AAV4LYQ7_BABCB|nr:periodic tryptophan protein 2-like protein, putative [Babesia caballi]
MSVYTLANICGAPYTGGRICFSPDGGCILAPVGNRVTVYDLQTSKSTTLSSQTRSDITIVAYHPTLPLAILIDVHGYGYILNLLRDRILHRLQFKSFSTVANEKRQAALVPANESQRMVRDAAFSPDARFFAVAVGSKLCIWRAPEEQLSWRMTLHRELTGHMDTISSLDWSSDSRFICTASADLTVRLWSVNPIPGFVPCAFVDHRRAVKAAFFSKDMRRICAISKEGVIIVWKAADDGDATLESGSNAAKHIGHNKKRAQKAAESEPAESGAESDIATAVWAKETQAFCNQAKNTVVSRVSFNKHTNLVVIGFTGGLFGLYKFPTFDSIYTLRIGNELPVVDSVDVSTDGDWLGLACSETGTLVVWEWKSETFVMKQQGHHSGVRCVAFSTGGGDAINLGGVVDKELKTDLDQNYAGNKLGLGSRYVVATGGFDGKVKLWDSNSGLCFVTFDEHTASVEAVCFTPQANAIITASLDGTVRAFDLLRYKNFRTLTASRVQFISVACDSSGSIVCAGSKGESNSVFIWSLQTGRLLDELHGHSSAVSGVAFHPSLAFSGFLVSASWDKFINVWNIYGRADKGGATEPILNISSVVAIAFDPRDNNVLAAAVLCGHILFWDLDNSEQIGSIDGIRDLQAGRDHTEFYAANNSRGGRRQDGDLQAGLNRNQHFNSIALAQLRPRLRLQHGDLQPALLARADEQPLVQRNPAGAQLALHDRVRELPAGVGPLRRRGARRGRRGAPPHPGAPRAARRAAGRDRAPIPSLPRVVCVMRAGRAAVRRRDVARPLRLLARRIHQDAELRQRGAQVGRVVPAAAADEERHHGERACGAGRRRVQQGLHFGPGAERLQHAAALLRASSRSVHRAGGGLDRAGVHLRSAQLHTHGAEPGFPERDRAPAVASHVAGGDFRSPHARARWTGRQRSPAVLVRGGQDRPADDVAAAPPAAAADKSERLRCHDVKRAHRGVPRDARTPRSRLGDILNIVAQMVSTDKIAGILATQMPTSGHKALSVPGS